MREKILQKLPYKKFNYHYYFLILYSAVIFICKRICQFALTRYSISKIKLLNVARSLIVGLAVSIIFFTPIPSTAADEFTPLLLAVNINQQDTNKVSLFLQTSEQDLLVGQADLQQWHIKHGHHQVIYYQHQRYYSLKNMGIRWQVDKTRMTIDLFVPASLLRPIFIDSEKINFIKPTPIIPGGFINYDANWQVAAGQQQQGSLWEAGLFNSGGTGVSSFLTQNGIANTPNFVRLNSTWTIDDPMNMRSLRIGDNFTNAGMWGESVGFGGIQWSTNFGTQPGFIPFPLPSVGGEAVVPSVVDLYVNNVLQNRFNVPAGPFAINAIPTLSESGNISLVTTDLLGRQQIISMPYYASGSLLKPGLWDYSYEAGFIRDNFGIASNDYGRFVLAGTQRLGLSNTFTGELHSELLADQQTVGVGGDWLLSKLGTVSLAVATSHSDEGEGGLGLVGLQHQAFNTLNFGVSTQMTTYHFMQLGIQPGQLAPSMLTQAFVAIPFVGNNNVSISYTRQNNRGSTMPNISFVTLSYNKSLRHNWVVNLSTLSNIGGVSNRAVFLTFTHLLNSRTSTNIGVSDQTGVQQLNMGITRNLPVDNGFGYTVMGAAGQQSNYQASLTGQANYGTYTATAANQQGENGYRLEAQGAVVFLDNQAYLTRSVNNSFGLVQVPNYPNVDVYANNQLIGKTDAKGNAIIPNLLDYNLSRVTIDPTELPLNTQIATTELTAIPGYRNGVLFHFPVKQTHAVIIKLMQTTGEPVPIGAVVTPLNSQRVFPVAEEGEVYLTDLTASNDFQASWDNHNCFFRIVYPKTKDPLPDLGTIICQDKL